MLISQNERLLIFFTQLLLNYTATTIRYLFYNIILFIQINNISI